MLQENKREFEIQNVNLWHKDNQGEGVTCVIIEGDDKPYDYMKNNVLRPFPHSEKTSHASATAGVLYQYAPKAKFVMLAIGRDSHIKETTDWITKHKNEIDVINCSYSLYSGKKDLEPILSLGIPFFSASGNDGDFNDGVDFPASHPNTIAVGASHIYKENTLKEKLQIGHYSDGGKELDCVSLTNIHYIDSEGEAEKFTHTSGATPSAVGMYILYASWRKRNGLPKLDINGVREFIKENTVDIVNGTNRDGMGMFILPSSIPVINKNIQHHQELIFRLKEGEYMKKVIDSYGDEYVLIRHKNEQVKVYNKYGQEVIPN